MQKVWEDANVKIGDVLSDVFGLSGQLIWEALVAGQSSAGEVAQLARGHARKKIAELTAALEGHPMRDAHPFLITRAMRHRAFLADEIEALDQEIARSLTRPDLSQPNQLLQTIPGIRTQAAAAMLAEGGPHMQPFPGAAHFTSWSGIAPGNHESAGKRRPSPTLRGNPHMKTALVESAWSASRTNGSQFQERYQRRQPGLGHKRTIVAVAQSMTCFNPVFLIKKLAPLRANLPASDSSGTTVEGSSTSIVGSRIWIPSRPSQIVFRTTRINADKTKLHGFVFYRRSDPRPSIPKGFSAAR